MEGWTLEAHPEVPEYVSVCLFFVGSCEFFCFSMWVGLIYKFNVGFFQLLDGVNLQVFLGCLWRIHCCWNLN